MPQPDRLITAYAGAAAGQEFDGRMLAKKKNRSTPAAPKYREHRYGAPIPPRKPGGPSRRTLLLGTVGTLLAAGAITAANRGRGGHQDQKPAAPPSATPVAPEFSVFNPYNNWERHQNSKVPQEFILQVGKNLAEDTKYPGFAEAGRILLLSQQNPEDVEAYYPLISVPIGMQFVDLTPEHTIAKLQHAVAEDYTKVAVQFQKKGGEVKIGTGVDLNQTSITVIFDNKLYTVTEATKRLLTVKELSHGFYMREQAKKITEEVLGEYSVNLNTTQNMEEFLWLNAFFNGRVSNIPPLSNLFDNAVRDSDGAGYWHIMRAFGKMKREGLVARDLQTLSNINNPFEQALKNGILLEKSQGEFVWKEGIGPFSPQWLAVIRPFTRSD